jgi:hypothetical protein
MPQSLSKSTDVISIYDGKILATSSGISIHHGTSTPVSFFDL